MKLQVVSLMMLAGVASAAQAEEIKVQKKAGGAQIADSLYGEVEGRVQTYQFNDAAGNTQGSRSLALRPKLGTKIANEKLNINMVLPVTNRQQSAVSTSGRPEVEANLSLFDSKNFSIDLYHFSYLKNNDADYAGYLDLDFVAKRDFQTAGGVLATSILFEPEAQLTTTKGPANVRSFEREDGTALAASEQEPAPEQRETDKAINVYPSVAFSPTAVPGLKTSLGAIFNNTYKARYVRTLDASGETEMKHDGYDVSRATQFRYTVKYQLKDGLYVYNQLRQNLDGYAEASTKASRLDNRTGIVMSLF